MSDAVKVAVVPGCDFCDAKAAYDARLMGVSGGPSGSWANVCEYHFDRYTTQRLGTGYGQRLVLAEETP